MTLPPTAQQPTPASYADFGAEPKAGPLRTVVQFFAIPLLITCVAVGIFLGAQMLFGSPPRTAIDFVELLRQDTVNRRWQAAFEIAARIREATIANGGVLAVPEEFRDPRLHAALRDALASARAEAAADPRPAQMLLLAMSLLGDPQSLEAVRATLDDASPVVRSFGVLALGRLRDRGSEERIAALARDEDAGCRQASLLALALLEQPFDRKDSDPLVLSPRTRELALVMLGDRHEDVRFQAAVVLGMAGDREAALPILRTMLDRDALGQIALDRRAVGVDKYTLQGNLILQAIGTIERLGALDDPEVRAAPRGRAHDATEFDRDVRERARQALARAGVD
jgi:hypothetical protein